MILVVVDVDVVVGTEAVDGFGAIVALVVVVARWGVRVVVVVTRAVVDVVVLVVTTMHVHTLQPTLFSEIVPVWPAGHVAGHVAAGHVT